MLGEQLLLDVTWEDGRSQQVWFDSSPNPVEALADALSKPRLLASSRAAVVGLLLRSTHPSVQEGVQAVHRHGLTVTKNSVPLPYRWERPLG